MRRVLTTLAALAAVLALSTHVALAAVTELPPAREGVYVYDLAEIWTDFTENTAQQIAEGIRERTGAQLAIVSWPSDQPDVSTVTAQIDAITIMATWGVGQQDLNDGLVVLFDMDKGSTEHGQIYLWAGEGFVNLYLNPDEAQVVVDQLMLPLASNGDLDTALINGLAEIDRVTQPGGNPDRGVDGKFVLPPSQEGVYVYDLARIWGDAAKTEAQSIAEAIRARTQAQLAIVSWPSDLFDVSTEDARADALTIMNTWGVGRAGIDDGLVVLFDMDEGSRNHGQIYLYAGKGFIERYLDPDEAAIVVNEHMLPLAKDGDIDGALLAGLRQVDRVVQPDGNPDRGTKNVINALLWAFALGIGLVAVLAFLRTWWERGRDAEVPLIDDSVLMPTPPPGLTPALATVLRNDGVDREAFTSALVDLGHRGLVTFEQPDGDKKHVDLVVPPSPLIDPNSLEARRRPLGSAEDALARSIKAKSAGGVLSWAELKSGEGAKLYASFQKNLGAAAKAANFFREDPNKLPAIWTGVGVGVIVLVVLFGFFFVFDLDENSSELFRPGKGFLMAPMLASIAMGVGVMAFSGRLVARTLAGAQALGMALGYRNTLRWELKRAHTVDEAVEQTRTRLPWITTPDLLTVWAVAFGLKDEIDDLIRETFETAKQTGTTVWNPTWYAGSGGISSVGNLASSIGSISTSATSSSGGGYGGGGGGGGGGAGGGF